MEERQHATALQYAPPPQPRKALDFAGEVTCDVRSGRQKMHRGITSLVGWSGAVFGYQSAEGECRLGYVIGSMPPPATGPRNVLYRSSKFARKLVTSSLGGEVYALREMVDYIPLIRGFLGR